MLQINDLNRVDFHAPANKRTARVIMTDEARVLRELRTDRQYSMRALGASMANLIVM